MKHLTQTIVLSILLVFLLVACGGEPESTTTTSSETAANSSEEQSVESEQPETEDASAVEEESIKLTWLILEFWNPDAVIAAYQELHPHIEIEAEKVGFGDLLQQNQIRLASGGGHTGYCQYRCAVSRLIRRTQLASPVG